MADLTADQHQRSISILEGEIQLAARQAVRRYKDATGRMPQAIKIQIEHGEDVLDVEVTTIPAPLGD
jgi:hypothetical protein